MVAVAISSAFMAAKKKEPTEQVGLRLKSSNLSKLRTYANTHPFQPSLTQLIDAAIAEFLERHARDVGDRKPK